MELWEEESLDAPARCYRALDILAGVLSFQAPGEHPRAPRRLGARDLPYQLAMLHAAFSFAHPDQDTPVITDLVQRCDVYGPRGCGLEYISCLDLIRTVER